MRKLFNAEGVYFKGKIRKNHSILIKDGRIEKVADKNEIKQFLKDQAESIQEINHPRQVLLPGAVNSHSHAFQIYLRGRAENPQNFRDWVDNYLYPFLIPLETRDIYASALLAFSEMIRNGINKHTSSSAPPPKAIKIVK